MTPEICLALIIYMESRGQSEADQVAVANVAINRTIGHKWPDTVCGVMSETRGGRYAYPWADNYSTPVGEVWEKAKRLSARLWAAPGADPTQGSTHHCAVGYKCSWEKALTLMITSDGHKFYQ